MFPLHPVREERVQHRDTAHDHAGGARFKEEAGVLDAGHAAHRNRLHLQALSCTVFHSRTDIRNRRRLNRAAENPNTLKCPENRPVILSKNAP